MKNIKTENYPSWLVPIEIAKELKRIGFNTNTVFLYNEEDRNKPKIFFGLNTLEEVDGQDDLEIEQMNFYQEADMEVYECILPTWEQVFEWFREKGLHSFIRVAITNLEFDKKNAERLKNPITFYKYVKGKDALGTLMFSIENYSEISSYNTFSTYEKCREELVKSLINDYKKLKIK